MPYRALGLVTSSICAPWPPFPGVIVSQQRQGNNSRVRETKTTEVKRGDRAIRREGCSSWGILGHLVALLSLTKEKHQRQRDGWSSLKLKESPAERHTPWTSVRGENVLETSLPLLPFISSAVEPHVLSSKMEGRLNQVKLMQLAVRRPLRRFRALCWRAAL